jgi:hypothetical protein
MPSQAVSGGRVAGLGGVPGMQAPEPLQVSAPSQKAPLLHAVPATLGVCVTPSSGSQLSSVHALPSFKGGATPTHAPLPLQLSCPLHTLPSEQSVPVARGGCTAPKLGSQ